MTESEALNKLHAKIVSSDLVEKITEQEMMAFCEAKNALEEIEQYRAIGTVEECRAAVKIYRVLNERKFTSENIGEYMKFEDECVKKGFTFKSLLEAREKQTAKRPDYESDGYGDDGELIYDTWICPCCGKHYEVDYDNYDYCPNCGQHIDRRANDGKTD